MFIRSSMNKSRVITIIPPLLQAVQDIGSPIGDHFCEDPRFAHDWPSYHLPSYFNAGMMMLNLKAMRQR